MFCMVPVVKIREHLTFYAFKPQYLFFFHFMLCVSHNPSDQVLGYSYVFDVPSLNKGSTYNDLLAKCVWAANFCVNPLNPSC